MTSKNFIKDIQMFINEAYSDKEPLQENQIKSKRVFNDYCNIIKQGLDRLEQLGKALEIIKNKCAVNTNLWLVVCTRTYEDYESFVENKDHKLVRIERNILTQPEYELLKEVLECQKD